MGEVGGATGNQVPVGQPGQRPENVVAKAVDVIGHQQRQHEHEPEKEYQQRGPGAA